MVIFSYYFIYLSSIVSQCIIFYHFFFLLIRFLSFLFFHHIILSPPTLLPPKTSSSTASLHPIYLYLILTSLLPPSFPPNFPLPHSNLFHSTFLSTLRTHPLSLTTQKKAAALRSQHPCKVQQLFSFFITLFFFFSLLKAPSTASLPSADIS